MGTYGEDIQSAVVAQIRAEVSVLGMTQAELSVKSGIPTSTLSRYLAKTKARDMPLPVLAEICKAIGMSPYELAGRAQRRLDGKDVR